MAWLYLFLAAGLEVAMGVFLKLNDGWTRLLPSGSAVAAALGSIFFLAQALRDLPLGTAYAVWTGVGMLGLVAVGIFFFGESPHWHRLTSVALVLIGLIGLRLTTN